MSVDYAVAALLLLEEQRTDERATEQASVASCIVVVLSELYWTSNEHNYKAQPKNLTF